MLFLDEGIEKLLNVAIHDEVEAVEGEADPVVGEPVLGEVVRADFFAPIAGADLTFSEFTTLFSEPLLLGLVQFGAQDSHGLELVLLLAALVLAGDDNPAGSVNDADGGFVLLHVLATGTAAAKCGDFEIFLVDFKVAFLGFGQNGDGDGAGVDTALRLGCGDALDAVDAALVLEAAVGSAAVNFEHDAGHTADSTFFHFDDFGFPAAPFGVTGVHAEDLGGEQTGFVAAGGAADLDDDVFLVIRVFGQEHDFELVFEGGQVFAGGVELGLGEVVHLGVPEEGFALFDVVLSSEVVANDGHDVFQFGFGAAETFEFGGVAERVRIVQLRLDFLVSFQDFA